MIEACRVAARTAGCEPALYVQPTHRLDLPRRYRTIINCGSFGLGGSRADDKRSESAMEDRKREGYF